MFKRASLPIALFSALLACVCALLGGGEPSSRTVARAQESQPMASPVGMPGPARR